MLRTILVDDEKPARDELRYMLETNHADAIHIIGEADTATKAISLITKSQPDLIFLDIHMPGLSGLEIASVIHQTVLLFLPQPMMNMLCKPSSYRPWTTW